MTFVVFYVCILTDHVFSICCLFSTLQRDIYLFSYIDDCQSNITVLRCNALTLKNSRSIRRKKKPQQTPGRLIVQIDTRKEKFLFTLFWNTNT